MFWLLFGSMIVFMTLVATVNLTPRYRVLTLTLLYFLSWDWTRHIGDRKPLFPPHQKHPLSSLAKLTNPDEKHTSA